MRTIVITGGTGGLGQTVVRRLAAAGRCIVLHRSELPADLGAEGVQCDVEDESSVRRAFETIGTLDALVHLAGGFEAGHVEETSAGTWSRMISLNVTSAFLVAREALPRMPDGGRIVAVSSAATLLPGSGTAAYTVSKSALNALVQVLAAEGRERKISANAILPTSLATPAMKQESYPSNLVPLERVAETIAFLLSEAAASITGALIPLKP